jgi:hypothetical protein
MQIRTPASAPLNLVVILRIGLGKGKKNVIQGRDYLCSNGKKVILDNNKTKCKLVSYFIFWEKIKELD